MEYYKYYLCVGLGIWLMAKVVDSSNPLADVGFVEEIVWFLLGILFWPIALVSNYVHSLHIRKLEEEIMKETQQLMRMLESSISPSEGPTNEKDDEDKGSA